MVDAVVVNEDRQLTSGAERTQKKLRPYFRLLLTINEDWVGQLHERAQDQLIEAMGDEFNRRLDQQLKALRLLNDPDAEREIGVQVLKQIEQEVYGQLTLDFLASQRMLNLLG